VASTTSGDNIENALNSLTQKIKNEKGVIAVAVQYNKTDNISFLAVTVQNDKIKKYVEKNMEILKYLKMVWYSA